MPCEPGAYSCGEAFKRLDDFLDRELTVEEMEMVKRHLEVCRECAEEFHFEDSLILCLKEKMARIDLPADLLQRMCASLDKV